LRAGTGGVPASRFTPVMCRSPDEQGGEALSGPRDYEKAKRLVAESGYKRERIVLLDAGGSPQGHAAALVTNKGRLRSPWLTTDKIMRLHAQTAMIESGFVHIPESACRSRR